MRKMLQVEHQTQMKNKINKFKSENVKELSKFFGVSTNTIRLDLKELEKLGFLQRTQGWAISKGIVI